MKNCRRIKTSLAAVTVTFALLQCWSGALAWSSSTTKRPRQDGQAWAACSRRNAISKIIGTASGALLLVGGDSTLIPSCPAYAADDTSTTSTSIYIRQQTISKQVVAWQIELPVGMKEGAKPVKTHLDEINFNSESFARYQYGVTVDPVRISSIQEFGTPEEVAARVVTAEVNRDGVFEVTLLEDPIATDDKSAYFLEYLSSGKRGKKVYLNKIFVSSDKLLYVLTAQCKEEDYATLKQEMKNTVKSFRVL